MPEETLRDFPNIAWENLSLVEMDDARRRAEHLARQATPELAGRVADLSFAYPNLSGGVATGMALAGIDALSPEADEINRRSVELDAETDTPGVGEQAWTIFKTGVRGLFTLASSLYDEVTKGTSQFVTGLAQGYTFEESARRSYGQSAGALAIAAARQGQRVNLGSGFLPRSELSPETIRRLQQGEPIDVAMQNPEQQRLGLPVTQFGEHLEETFGIAHRTAEGKRLPVTPGRALASFVTEPGSGPYNAISGVGDVASNIFLDPANIIGVGIGDLQKANRLLAVSGFRGGVLTRNVDDWLASPEGGRVVNWIAGNDRYDHIYGLLHRSSPSAQRVNAKLAKDLTELTDPGLVATRIKDAVNDGTVRRVLNPQSLAGRLFNTSGVSGAVSRAAGRTGSAVDIGGLRFAIRHASDETSFLGRWAAEVGAKSIDPNNLDEAVFAFGQYLKAADFADDRISEYMYRLADLEAGDFEGAYSVVVDSMREFGQGLADAGLPQPVADAVTNMFRSVDDYRAFWINAAGDPVMAPGAKGYFNKLGELTGMPTAELFTEFLDHAVPLVDIRAIRKALSRKRWVNMVGEKAGKTWKTVDGRFGLHDMDGWEDFGPGVINSLMDNIMTRAWKPMVLLRPAWTFRVVMEEQMRLMAMGLDSPIFHPLSGIALSMGMDKTLLGEVMGGVKNLEQAVDEFAAAMTIKGGGWAGFRYGRAPFSNEWRVARIGDAQHGDGWAIQLRHLADDPIAARIATRVQDDLAAGRQLGDDTLDEIKKAFWDGDLKQYREKLIRQGKHFRKLRWEWASDALIDSRLARMVQFTGGSWEGHDMIVGKWFDMYGRPLPIDVAAGRGLPIRNGGLQAYNGIPPELRGRGMDLLERLNRVATDDPAIVFRDDESIMGVAEMLDEAHQWLSFVDPDLIPDEIARRASSFGRELLDTVERGGSAADLNEILYDAVGRFNTALADASETVLNPAYQSMPAREAIELYGTADQIEDLYGGIQSGIRDIDPAEIGKLPPAGRGEVDRAYSTFESMSQMTPWEMDGAIPNHVHRIKRGAVTREGRTYDGYYATDEDGWVVGQMILVRDQTGRAVDVNPLQVAHNADGTEQVPGTLQRLLGEVMRDAVTEGEQDALWQMGFGGVPLRQWFETAGVDTTGLTNREILDVIRQQYGASWAGRLDGPLGELPSIELSRDGARALDVFMRRAARESSTASVAQWPEAQTAFRIVTPPNPDLWRVLATGQLDDLPFARVSGADELAGPSEVGQRLLDQFGQYAPEAVPVARRAAAKDQPNLYDRIVDSAMSMLGSYPTNLLSRSPAFRQLYYKRVGELFPAMDGPTQRAAIEAAREAGLDRVGLRNLAAKALGGEPDIEKTLLRLAEKPLRAKPGTQLDLIDNLEDVDEIAKAFALQETKALLYDLSKRRNFFDMTRHIFPFGEAWSEIITTWARIIQENPNVLRRIQQGIEGAREQGIFYTDPATDEEVVAWPPGGLLANWLFKDKDKTDGLKATPQFRVPVQGLNIALNGFLPGFGPIIQTPVALVGRDIIQSPDFRWLHDLIYPFGLPSADSPGGIIDSALPAWFKKFVIAWDGGTEDDDRILTNMAIDAMRAMEVNGEIDMSDPEGLRDAWDEARSRARAIFAIRAASQFIGPAGAGVRWDVEYDSTGEAFAFQVLATEYRRLKEENDQSDIAATAQFREIYGFDPFALIQAKTRQIVPRSVTDPGLDFQRANPELFEEFPLTAYYARPDGPDEDFYYPAYLDQLEEKMREPLTEEQWTREANKLRGSLAYQKARDYAMATGRENEPAMQAWLRTIRTQLIEQYPGYGVETPGLGASADADEVRREFAAWMENPDLAATEAGQGLAEYLTARNFAHAEAEALGITPTGFATANRTAYLRNWLYAIAQDVVVRHPDFAPIWERWYRYEVEEPASDLPSSFLGVPLTPEAAP